RLERLERELVVGSDEDDLRQCIALQLLEHAEAIEPGHLNVEEDDVGPHLADCGNGLLTVLAFADDLEILFIGEVDAHAVACERFVVDDEYAPAIHHAVRASVSYGAPAVARSPSKGRKGMTTRTMAPPPGAFTVSSLCSLP